MSDYLIPTTPEIVEHVARSIAKDRLERSALRQLANEIGKDAAKKVPDSVVDSTVDEVFERLWAGTSVEDKIQRESYRLDAIIAIRSINLKLITQTEESR